MHHRNTGAESRKLHSAGQLRDTPLMTIRCDHCRGTLGPSTRRYCAMRFCSPACVEAYQHRLDEQTKEKIAHLGFAAVAGPLKARFPRLYGFGRRSPAE